MSREKLRQAIKYYSEEASLSHSDKIDDFIAVLLAAARAYACECGGNGRIRNPNPFAVVEWQPCSVCKEYRKIADGEGMIKNRNSNKNGSEDG